MSNENDELTVKAWLVTGGRLFTDKVCLGATYASEIASTRNDGSGTAPLVLLSDAQRIRDERNRLRAALATLLDTFERCEAGHPPHIEVRFASRDKAHAALAQAEKGERGNG